MKNATKTWLLAGVIAVSCAPRGAVRAQPPSQPPPDAVVQAQTPQPVATLRPEQRKTPHDLSNVFAYSAARPVPSVEP